MNVFMPCATIEDSVRALDNKRLIKQILECEQILEANKRVNEGEQKVGYANHPIVKHYRDLGWGGTLFLILYEWACCREYKKRFGKDHHAYDVLFEYWMGLVTCKDPTNPLKGYKIPPIMYAEGSIKSPNCIRETDSEKVFELFKQKLIKKWNSDKYPPRWTNRGKPSWYKGERK